MNDNSIPPLALFATAAASGALIGGLRGALTAVALTGAYVLAVAIR